MNNELTLGRRSNLVMPTHYVELDKEEMAYVDGGWSWKKFWGWTAICGTGVALSINILFNPEPASKLALTAKLCESIAFIAGVGELMFSD